MEWSPFFQIAGVLGVSAAVSALGMKLRQPLIISFIFAGIIVGPSVLGLIEDVGEIELLASIGISLLLFVVGLKLDLNMIRTVGPVALATGLGQVAFTSLFGFLLALAFRMELVSAVYVSVALTFSSTIIIVKLLSDKKEIDSLHGRIAVGFLIVQDLAAILALIGLTAFGPGPGEDQSFSAEALWILGKGAGMVVTVLVLMRWVLPWILNYIARSQEMLVLFAITWAVAFSAGSEWLGFSKEVGAFLAGISLASTPQRDSIGARLVVLRDFLLLFFFIHLGAQLQLAELGAELGTALVFSIFVLVGNPLIVMAIMGWMGYRKRTGFMAGLAVAQISEFSLILAALGLSLGHIDSSTMGMITLVGLVTICASTYLILYSGAIYARLARFLGLFERANPYRETQAEVGQEEGADRPLVIVMGVGDYGSVIATRLQQHGWRLIAVDFDPQALARSGETGLQVFYGDVGDPEVLGQLPLHRARWVVCAVRDREINLRLFHLLAEAGFQGRVALTAGDQVTAEEYQRIGAHLVLQPFSDAAEQAVEAVTGTIHSLPGFRHWPVVLEEVSLLPGSIFTGRTLRELDLRRELGVSVLAVSRAGTVHFNPSPDLRMYPGDRVVLLSPPEQAGEAVKRLQQRELGAPQDQAEVFAAAELTLPSDSEWAGRSLAELNLPDRFGVTVVGIRRGAEQRTTLRAGDVLEPEDCILVVGSPDGIRAMRAAQVTTPAPDLA